MPDLCKRDIWISIHALLAESDCRDGKTDVRNSLFLSTLSLRRATPQIKMIGAPVDNFYPRSPCGERHETYVVMEATKVISIHALLAESDPLQFAVAVDRFIFLSTLSLRRATNGPHY